MRKQRFAEPNIRFSVRDWARKIWTAIDTPLSRKLLESSDFDVVSTTVSPSDYQTAQDFFLDYQAAKLLSKYPSLRTGIDTKKVAIEKFLECEDQCHQTNERFFGWRSGRKEFLPAPSVSRVLFYAARKISDILGDVPSLSDLDFRFGPGASFGTRGDTSVFKKMQAHPECTVAFTRILSAFRGEFPSWSLETATDDLSIVMGSELTVVPKDAKTGRPICIEPSLNGLFQKGVGSYISDRLLRFGVNLRDQSINSELSRRAYTENLATVDFSSASDTIAYGLVLELLPIDWFEFLDVARSPCYRHDGRWNSFKKFSSMGNAYTFELESMIFYALATSVCRELNIPYKTGVNLSVYGDDVIIPREAFDLFAQVSQFCGFRINEGKSFKEGFFFESCGTDWFQGTNVRPLLLKAKPNSLQEVYFVANLTLEIAKRFLEAGCCHNVVQRVMDCHAWVISVLPRGLRLLVPYSQGGGEWLQDETRRSMGISSHAHSGLWSDFDIARPVRHRDFDGFVFRALVETRKLSKQKSYSFSYALYWAQSSKEFDWRSCPTDIRMSGGYSHRQSPKIVSIRRQFWFGPWPFLPVKWSERAVALCARSQAP